MKNINSAITVASISTLAATTTLLSVLAMVACTTVEEDRVSQADANIFQEEEVHTVAEMSDAPQDNFKKFDPNSARPLLARVMAPSSPQYHQEPNRKNYRHRDANSFLQVSEKPVSTFSIDVDSAAYANARRYLSSGALPPADAIRSEEFINYFDYQYPAPDNRKAPFSITTEVAPSPWAMGRHLLHVGLQGYEIESSQLPPANLVFLVDVSGSMNYPNKLGLLKNSLKLLSKSLRKNDTVSIVVYAGASGVVLPATAGNDRHAIYRALKQLQAGGSTNGAAGIELAYQIARQEFKDDGVNRVILATDGDFNVGVTNIEALKDLVKQQRGSGIELTTLGFGTGNYNDALMNELAEIGNGNAAYIDTAKEARKALVEQLSGTLYTIAKDVKIQIEFSPQVAEYRLIGYESRLLKREDFNNDKVDAGEIGAGHSVTALYEIVLTDSNALTVDPLRYSNQPQSQEKGDELAYLKLRYKLPEQTTSTLLQQAIKRQQITPLDNSSENFRWSAAAAAFAQHLSGNTWLQDFGYAELLALAQGARGNDRQGYRAEMIQLVKMAQSLQVNEHLSAR
ncbi:von Willebrand factor type A domain-containing protein [Porticoccus sp. W117]|uniref:vWA domain-containing protein n=1 Tax=Porticoccus sp. W117 TaxID=3054777 RepID=UPI0025931515|nr:von Willebrand factor type A domain-containing protein [Porticoccus sp. W117]MDM3871993.1 von Willebrand factor type A domain-containing protein [Porticoccus sp. W117]